MTKTIVRTAPADVIGAWPLTSRRTRAHALEGGALVPATEAVARQAGWRHPVAYAADVDVAVIAWSEQIEAAKRRPTGQDQLVREWDVLYLAAAAVRRGAGEGPRWTFTVSAVPAAGPDVRLEDSRLVVHLGPGDDGEPVVTIMEAGHR